MRERMEKYFINCDVLRKAIMISNNGNRSFLWVSQHSLGILAFPRGACTPPCPEDLNLFLRASPLPLSLFPMWLVPAQGLTSLLDRSSGISFFQKAAG